MGAFLRGNNMAMMLVDGVELPTPSTFEWGMIDVSASDSGRTQDAKMHKNRIAQKRQLKLSWSGTDTARTAQILQILFHTSKNSLLSKKVEIS